MVPPQDVVAPPVEQKKPELEQTKLQEQEQVAGADQQMDHQMLSPRQQQQMELPLNTQMQQHIEPQQLLLQCQVCGGLSLLGTDQIQPGAEIGCGFCGSPSVIIQDTNVQPSISMDYSYAPPIDLFAGMSLSDGLNNLNIADLNDVQAPPPPPPPPPPTHPMFDPSLPFGSGMLAQHQFQDQMFPQMQPMPHEVPKTGVEIAGLTAGTVGEAGADDVTRGRRRPLPSPGLENEMKRRSWVVSNLREQHEEFMRLLEEEEKAEEAKKSNGQSPVLQDHQEPSPSSQLPQQQPTKEDAMQAGQDKLTGGSGGVGGESQDAEGDEMDAMQAHMIGTMMALRQQMELQRASTQAAPEEPYRFADAEDPDEYVMVDANDAMNPRGGETSSDEETQIFATPEQAEQMRRRREELKKDEQERERTRRWRTSNIGSLGVDRRSVGAVG